MKKLLYMLFAVCLTLVLVSCSQNNAQDEGGMVLDSSTEIQNQDADATNSSYTKNEEQPFWGKIAIITYDATEHFEEYFSAQLVVQKYGEDKIIHKTWPIAHLNEYQQIEDMVIKLGSDPDIKAIIVHDAVVGSNSAFTKLKESRDDIFVAYCQPRESKADSVQNANLCLAVDELGMGPAMVQQARAMGAKVFVHYSFPRHMENSVFAMRCVLMAEECTKLGMEFVDATALDPIGEAGVVGSQQFILDDVPKMVEQYGKDTAFFATNCSLQPSLIEAVIATGALYPQPCCPSPYHGFPTALDIELGDVTLDAKTPGMLATEYLIEEERAAVAEKGMTGRLSTWPAFSPNLLTMTNTEYAIKWINGEVPQEGVDVDVLKQLMMDYAGVEVYLTPYTDAPPYTEEGTGETYDNFLLMRMDYITF